MIELYPLGIAYNINNSSVYGFLFGNLSLNEIDYQNKKIVLIGTGQQSAICTLLLNTLGFEVHAYCDNNENLSDRVFLGKPIYSPYVLFGSDEYHFITTASRSPQVMNAQLVANGVTRYSHFFCCKYRPMENSEHERVLELARNALLNSLYTSENFVEACNDWESESFGFAKPLLTSSPQWKPVFEWSLDYLESNPNITKILEIGPGIGLFSVGLYCMKQDLSFIWIDSTSVRQGWLNSTMKEKLQNVFIGNNHFSPTLYYGDIEDPSFQIQGKYDCIIMTEVMEHFKTNPIATIKRIAEMLTENGRLYLSTPNWGALPIYKNYRDMKEYDSLADNRKLDYFDFGHCYIYSQKELHEIFTLCGLNIQKYICTPENHHNYVLVKQSEGDTEQND